MFKNNYIVFQVKTKKNKQITCQNTRKHHFISTLRINIFSQLTLDSLQVYNNRKIYFYINFTIYIEHYYLIREKNYGVNIKSY